MNVKEVIKFYLNDESKSVLYVNINTKEADELEGTYSVCLTKDNGWEKAIEHFGNCESYNVSTMSAGYVVEITLKNIVEIEDNNLLEIGFLAFQRHSNEFGDWNEGEPIKIWSEENCEVCVKYESGKWWHYKDLDLPFPTFW